MTAQDQRRILFQLDTPEEDEPCQATRDANYPVYVRAAAINSPSEQYNDATSSLNPHVFSNQSIASQMIEN